MLNFPKMGENEDHTAQSIFAGKKKFSDNVVYNLLLF